MYSVQYSLLYSATIINFKLYSLLYSLCDSRVFSSKGIKGKKNIVPKELGQICLSFVVCVECVGEPHSLQWSVKYSVQKSVQYSVHYIVKFGLYYSLKQRKVRCTLRRR